MQNIGKKNENWILSFIEIIGMDKLTRKLRQQEQDFDKC